MKIKRKKIYKKNNYQIFFPLIEMNLGEMRDEYPLQFHLHLHVCYILHPLPL